MTDIVIREIHGEELLTTAMPMMAYAFGASPPLPSIEDHREHLPYFEERTTLALFEDGKPAATADYAPMTQNVRGKIFPKAGVAGVTTAPWARRKGYGKRILKELTNRMREGFPFACLYPFRESFYERMGYITLPEMRIAKFPVSELTPLLNWDLDGTVEQVAFKDGYDEYLDYLLERQQVIHGMSRFGPISVRREGERRQAWLTIARDSEGHIVGVMAHKIDKYLGTFQVGRFLYSDNRARYLLLSWFARHVDQVTDVSLLIAPDELPETWLSDLNTRVESAEGNIPMGRVVDVLAIGGMQTGPGRITIRITDSFCEWNNGDFTFETVDGALTVSPAQTEPDCELTINGLSALVYGAHDPRDFVFRGWGSIPSEMIPALETMFPHRRAYLHEYY